MADNATTQSGTPATLPPGFQIATDDVANIHFQKIKIDVGGDGISAPLSAANPIPVSIQNSSLEISNDVGNPVPVSGSVAITNSSIEISNDVGNPVPVSGSVSITNSSIEIANDVGNPVPVSGTVAISNSSFEISNDVGNPVPVNVSGVTVGEKTAAASLPVVLATENSTDFSVDGPAAQSALNALAIPQTDITKYRFVLVQIDSTATAGTYIFEQSNNNVNWVGVALQDVSATNSATIQYTGSVSNRMFQGAVTGKFFRVRISAALTGGTIQAFANFAQSAGPLGIQGISAAATLSVSGNAAQNVGVSSNLNQIGFESRITQRSATADAAASRPVVDKLGRSIVADGQIRELTDTNTLTLTTITETILIAAVAAVNNDVRELVIANTSATAVRVDFRDSTAGTVRLSVMAEAGKTLFLEFTRLKQAAVNTSWTAQLSAAVTDVRITVVSERVS